MMMTKNADKKREQMMMFSMDSMVPQDHMLRLIDKAINWNFIYDLVEDKYSVKTMVVQVWILLCSLKFHLFNIFMESKVCVRRSERLK